MRPGPGLYQHVIISKAGLPDFRFRSTERDLDREQCFELLDVLQVSNPNSASFA